MALLVILLLTGLWVVTATVRSVLTDGRGHHPRVRSHESWSAGDLPSMPYSSARLW
ncbi:hypothetical protein [Arthrobacter globiformis]|uniref:hypothetical protein n=1 Tax=Arthrobacter globiformis TaxID=1665 RepID=UPI00167D82A7|nr:hypothetical protein [Arthrobacter globiformis]